MCVCVCVCVCFFWGGGTHVHTHTHTGGQPTQTLILGVSGSNSAPLDIVHSLCVSFEWACTRRSVLNYLQSSWIQRVEKESVLGFSSVAASLTAYLLWRWSHSMADVFALPAVNAICNLTVGPLVMFPLPNVCCNFFFSLLRQHAKSPPRLFA